MQKIAWSTAFKTITPRVFKIRSPRGHGTGFHVGNFGSKNQLCALATAFHVVRDVLDWDEPIKIVGADGGKEYKLTSEQMTIFPYPKSDLAIIVFDQPRELNVPNEQLEHLVPTHHLLNGAEIAWCGFPGLRSDKLCFFHGYISCYLNQTEGYLVDGTAINGVSGGPVFYISSKKMKPVVAGVITAYIANRATGDTLPGVSMIAPVSPYEVTIKFLRNLPDAAREAEKQKKDAQLKNVVEPVSPPK